MLPDELILTQFAKRHGVSEKTIRRDLAAFRSLGQELKCEFNGDQYVWQYSYGIDFLFVANRNVARKWAVHEAGS